MFRPEKPETANFHTKCATLPDFRDALEQDMKGFLSPRVPADRKSQGSRAVFCFDVAGKLQREQRVQSVDRFLD
jgi:hypothetical protein